MLGSDLARQLTGPRKTIHIWIASLEQDDAQVRALALTLSPDEAEKARRFRFDRDRRRYTVCRGTLRLLLGAYTGIAPGLVQLEYSLHGKPALAGSLNPQGIRFNLSHSNEIAIYALACRYEVGIDVEYIQPLADAPGIAERFFSPAEGARIAALTDPAEQLAAFYDLWTRKEAYLKALGEGLTHDLSFDLSSLPGPSETAGDGARPGWAGQSFRPLDDYQAALFVEGAPCDLTIYPTGNLYG